MSKTKLDNWNYSTLLSCNGKEKIRVATYLANGVECDHWFVFLNGRSEFIEKYMDLPKDLDLPANVGFLTWDHQGQGKSGGPRSHISSYDIFAEDAQMLIRKFVGHKPYVMMGHSMGGLVALYTSMKYHLEPQRLVLCSPLLKFPSKPFSPKVAGKISEIAKLTGLSRLSTGVGKSKPSDTFAGNRYTHSKEAWEQILNTPFACPGASFGWVHATQNALKFVYSSDNLKKLKVPVLILGGSEEVVVDPKGFSEWTLLAQQYIPSDIFVEFRMILGARHEIFSEIKRYRREAVRYIQEFFADDLNAHSTSKIKSA